MTTVSTMPTVRKLRLDGFVVGPVPCQSCRSLVWFGRSLTRVKGETVMGEVLAWREWRAYRIHHCPFKLPSTKQQEYMRAWRARRKAEAAA